MPAVWRAEDEGLLERLQDEQVLRALFSSLTHDHATPPPARAAGLVHQIRQTPEGGAAVQAALDGDLMPVRRLVCSESYRGLAPPLLHHLALLHQRVAEANALPSENHGRANEDLAIDAWVHTLAAWMALADEHDYLESVALAVAPNPATAAAALQDATMAPLAALGAAARSGVAERTLASQRALRVLGQMPRAIVLSGLALESPAVTTATVRARTLRIEALEIALDAVAEALDEASARSVGGPAADQRAVLDVFQRSVELWHWTDQAVEVERFLIDRAGKVGWDFYNARDWNGLRRLCQTLQAPVDRMATRIQQDRLAGLAYTARCAQQLVFRAEMEANASRQLELAERAIALCPTHRNGRLVLSDLLALRASRTLRDAPILGRKAQLERAYADALRARELWPSTPRLIEVGDALLRQGMPLPPESEEDA